MKKKWKEIKEFIINCTHAQISTSEKSVVDLSAVAFIWLNHCTAGHIKLTS